MHNLAATRSLGAPLRLGIDLDGVVNRSPGAGYVTRVEDFHLNDGLVELVQLVADRGYVAVLVTSQRCVGKGLLTAAGLEQIHGELHSRLAREGLGFLDIYAFLGTPETETWEKPNPDMILLAAEKHGIEVRTFRCTRANTNRPI